MAKKKKETGPVIVSKYVDKKFGPYNELMTLLRELTIGGVPISRAPTGLVIGESYYQWRRPNKNPVRTCPHFVKLHTYMGVWRILYGEDSGVRARVNLTDPNEAVFYLRRWVVQNKPPPPNRCEEK